MATELAVTVAYGSAEQQTVRSVCLPPGSTAEDAILAAGCAEQWQDGRGGRLTLACYGRKIEPTQRLVAGDRIEILRPLTADPKDQRRARVSAVRKQSARNRVKAR